jgi:hypothetical protein
MEEFEKSFKNAGKTSELTAELLRKSLGNQLLTLASSATELGFKIFEAFEIQGKKGLTGLTEAIRKFDVKPLIASMRKFLKVTTEIWTVVKPLVSFFFKHIDTFLILAIAIKAITAAQWLWNVAMAANPIGLIIAGIGLLIAGGILLVKNWKAVKKEFISTFQFILDKVAQIGQALGFEMKGIESLINRLEFAKTDMDVNAAFEKVGQQVPPNRAEVAARQGVDLKGRIEIAGAPEGSKAEMKTKGAPPIDMRFIGTEGAW